LRAKLSECVSNDTPDAIHAEVYSTCSQTTMHVLVSNDTPAAIPVASEQAEFASACAGSLLELLN
jgi:hypothetical protein